MCTCKTAFRALALLALLTGVASAAAIPIPNGDMEQGDAVWRWMAVGGDASGTVDMPYAGMDPTGHGSKIAWLNGYGDMWQHFDGDYYVEANTMYTMSVDVGKHGSDPGTYYSAPSFDVAGYDGV